MPKSAMPSPDLSKAKAGDWVILVNDERLKLTEPRFASLERVWSGEQNWSRKTGQKLADKKGPHDIKAIIISVDGEAGGIEQKLS